MPSITGILQKHDTHITKNLCFFLQLNKLKIHYKTIEKKVGDKK